MKTLNKLVGNLSIYIFILAKFGWWPVRNVLLDVIA